MVCLASPSSSALLIIFISDNPINQTILSTFMKKKKIKYDVAKNGEEAVQKWRTGGFHLILVSFRLQLEV
jgi:osomolarity two-component system response regulator SSK1